MFGIIHNGKLIKSEIQLDGYKPLEFQPIPENFDQSTQYVIQKEPIDQGDVIFIGVEVHDLPPDDSNDEMDLFN